MRRLTHDDCVRGLTAVILNCSGIEGLWGAVFIAASYEVFLAAQGKIDSVGLRKRFLDGSRTWWGWQRQKFQ
jgi:hypothetical protein